ncbi:CaiB/BaiF CoA transferase family protein [Pseudorhodoferax sp.]|uniref:CaiB/BaiF CoA transferase family protein n=1 Tax=Pseudorhodoferax sp. TaxID=1993553 RepID=UPI002DD639C5|nr:CaiB/BaiF CoA-transferase family protein [Pseudorhodoferax sp.]
MTVIEIAAIGPVPWACMLLVQMGATVVRIDRPGPPPSADPMRAGRTVVELDLKTSTGRDSLLERLRAADALVEGMRPGVMERLGLGPADCKAVNPRLVYGRMTGWGQNGPLAPRAGHDINYIALTGALHAIGPASQPCPPLNLIGDYGGGGCFLAMGVLAALLAARRGAPGCVVDAAMIDGTAALMALAYGRLADGRWRDEREANMLDGGAPWYRSYATADGRFVAVGAIEPPFYEAFIRGLGLDLQALPDREQRDNWPALHRRFADVLRTRTRDEWTSVFEDTDACVTPVLSMAEAPLHAHHKARRTFVATPQGHALPGPAPRFLPA